VRATSVRSEFFSFDSRYLDATRPPALRNANCGAPFATLDRATNKEGYEEGESGCCFVSDCVSALESAREPLEKCIEFRCCPCCEFRASFPRSPRVACSESGIPPASGISRPVLHLGIVPSIVEASPRLNSNLILVAARVTFLRSHDERLHACRSRPTRRVCL
jgi:hypothetical protein